MRYTKWMTKVSPGHFDQMAKILHSPERLANPDLIIARPDSYDPTPYLLRWHVIPKNDLCNVYLHLMLADDPAGVPHDHPWHNSSMIVAGSYLEHCGVGGRTVTYRRLAGEYLRREAKEAHWLSLPDGEPYCLSLFTTGPVLPGVEWGFYEQVGATAFVPHHKRVSTTLDGLSVYRKEGTA